MRFAMTHRNRRNKHLLPVNGNLAHFLLQHCQFLGKPRHPSRPAAPSALTSRGVKLAQIARDALLQLGTQMAVDVKLEENRLVGTTAGQSPPALPSEVLSTQGGSVP
jgi:hypothetical protein